MKKPTIPATTLLVGIGASLIFSIGIVNALISSRTESDSNAQVQQPQGKAGLAAYTLSSCRRMLSEELS